MFANPGLFMSNFAFSQYNNKYSTEFDNKSKAGVLGIQTRDRKVVGTDESAKLWCPPPPNKSLLPQLLLQTKQCPIYCSYSWEAKEAD